MLASTPTFQHMYVVAPRAHCTSALLCDNMSEGRGGTTMLVAGTALLLLLGLLSLCETASAATYAITWDLSVNPSIFRGNQFKAGDTVVFKYSPREHNLVRVSHGQYRSCSAPGAKARRTGNDRVTLKKGRNYFLCGIPGHCQAGMKLAIYAAA